jgi:hypothetical protein
VIGGQRREHRDLEVAMPSERFGEIADALAGYELFVVFRLGPERKRWLCAALERVHPGDPWLAELGSGS